MTKDLQHMRREFAGRPLMPEGLSKDPFEQFTVWFNEAISAEVEDPNAMALATAGANKRPMARVVLLKGIETGGFVFYTNYSSRKARELEENDQASLLFFWSVLARQVRISGTVRRVPRSASEAYFATRPRESQIAAWVSHQSAELKGREDLEEAFAAAKERFGDGPIPLPGHWGGFSLVPDIVEFWQGRPNRLHDRIEYRRQDSGWRMARLYP